MERDSTEPMRRTNFMKRFPFRLHRFPNYWATMDPSVARARDAHSVVQDSSTPGPVSLFQNHQNEPRSHEAKTRTLPPISPIHRQLATEGRAGSRTIVETGQSMTLFYNAANTVMSSAPTSPTSSDGETLDTPRLTTCGVAGRNVKKRFVHRHTTAAATSANPTATTLGNASTARWRRRAGGMMTQCSPFFNLHIRTHNPEADFGSPYQSDVSQSAPSSPTIDTYETVPLIDPFTCGASGSAGVSRVVMMDGRRLAGDDSGGLRTDLPAVGDGRAAVSRCTDQPGDNVDGHQSTALGRLLERLGIQSVWPCLRNHNVTDLTRLSQLTRRDLIDMGVLDAETRATLMTAARLLTDSWLAPSFLTDLPQTRPLVKTCDQPESLEKRFADEQALHDSGCSSSNELACTNAATKGSAQPTEVNGPMGELPVQNCVTAKPTIEQISFLHRTNQRNFADLVDRKEANEMGAGSLQPSPLKSTQNAITGDRKCFASAGYPDPVLLLTSDSSCRGATFGQRESPALGVYYSRAYDIPMPADTCVSSRAPVGILRNARASEEGSCLRRSETGRRANSAAPKCVKIDERSLISASKERRGVEDSHQTSPDSQQLQRSGSSGPSACMIPGCSMQSNQPMTVSPHILLQQKLKQEDIDLTRRPYSTDMGQANIPLRLTQRYASELNSDLITVAVSLELERESRLREAGRPVISFMDDIQSRRFLNCDGIKTGTIEDFLIGIGLPMYICRVLELRSKSETKHSLNKPADLLRLSDHELTTLIGLPPHHVAWLRREAAVIPSAVFTQNAPRRANLDSHRHNARVNSLSRHSRKLIRQGSQVLLADNAVRTTETPATHCTSPDRNEPTVLRDKF